MAKNAGVKGYSTLTKVQLINALGGGGNDA